MTTTHPTVSIQTVDRAFERAIEQINGAVTAEYDEAWRAPIVDEVERGLDQVAAALHADLASSGRDQHTREQVSEAANRVADARLVGESDTGLRDAVNLLVNAGAHYLDAPAGTLEDVADGSYGQTLQTILDWICD